MALILNIDSNTIDQTHNKGGQNYMEEVNSTIFDLSPMAMWIQDFSGVKQIFQQWHDDGIQDLKQYLLEDPERLVPCLMQIKTIQVNQSTLDLYEAVDLDEILQNFARMHAPIISVEKVLFFAALWNNEAQYICPSVNYTCKGKQIDILLRASFMPGYKDSWERLLLTTENISAYQSARRYSEALFTNSPTPLWIFDYSQIKLQFDAFRAQGIENLREHFQTHPEALKKLLASIRFLDINQAGLDLFKIKNKYEFEKNIADIFSISTHHSFTEQLIQLWQGQSSQQRESSYYDTQGNILYVLEQINIFPSDVDDWAVIQIALTDITVRKQLENHLHYLGNHDILTRLYNRTFFSAEIERLNTQAIFPRSCIFLDMNGLKTINDHCGHAAGDQLLRRMGQILSTVMEKTSYTASRIGGDEFVILMPHADESHVQQMLQQIEELIRQDNSQHNMLLSVAMGYSTTHRQEHMDELLKRADQNMYKNKHDYYQQRIS